MPQARYTLLHPPYLMRDSTGSETKLLQGCNSSRDVADLMNQPSNPAQPVPATALVAGRRALPWPAQRLHPACRPSLHASA